MGLSTHMDKIEIDELGTLCKEGKNNLSHKWTKVTFGDNSSNIQFSLRPHPKITF
jgi:hypothetical protein